MALAEIRGGTINSIDEGSQQAFYCSLFYEICRDQCLEDAPWGFAAKIHPLALMTGPDYEVFNWVNVYQYPVDCLRVRRLIRNFEFVNSSQSGFAPRHRIDRIIDTPVEYQIMNVNDERVIVANESELRMEYTMGVTNPGLFSSSFTIALSKLLASQLALPIVGDKLGQGRKQSALAEYQRYINNAISNDLNQRYSPPVDSEHITIRG